jgi:glycosyltransferase involved in cell wall biosynthesis
MPLTILSVAFPMMPVGPHASGGSEQILFLVEKGIVELGNRSVVISARGSHVSGELIETDTWDGKISPEMEERARADHLAKIQQALADFPIDLIHFHGLDFYRYLPQREIPMLATLHLPIPFYPSRVFERPAVSMNFVSESQAQSYAFGHAWPVIRNGIDISAYTEADDVDDYALVVARICPEKGIHYALEAAHRCGVRLLIAGPVHPYPAHLEYFESQVRPMLDEKRVYLGAANLEMKQRLLRKARCLIVPSTVAETSSLVSMEALASGTPVIAFQSGALPEIIRHGVTGFIVGSAQGIENALAHIHEIDRSACRREAEQCFSAKTMVKNYVEHYRTLMSGNQPQLEPIIGAGEQFEPRGHL